MASAVPKVLAAWAIAAVGVLLYRRVRQGQKPEVFVLHNKKGVEVHITTIGGVIQKLLVPDRQGKVADVVLGFESPSDYVDPKQCPYFGAVVGRCANRIAHAAFKLEGKEYQLAANDGAHALHGGLKGLHRRRWVPIGDPAVQESPGSQSVTLMYRSADMEEGYPGNVAIIVKYALSKNSNELRITFEATTDKATPVNIAQHSYFNLAGHDSGSVLPHVVRMNADHYTPVSQDLIPTGEILPVAGTPFDFTSPHSIGERINQIPRGYDHNFVLFGAGPAAGKITQDLKLVGMASSIPRLAATISDPVTGRTMELLTNAPGLQFYSGNFLDGTIVGKGGIKYAKHAGFCVETQGFPNAINTPNFPSVLVKPGEVYKHDVVYKFT